MNHDNHDGSEAVLTKQPCSECGSSDAKAYYDNGHSFCFACSKHKWEDQDGNSTRVETAVAASDIPKGEYLPLTKRGITLESCRRWGYTCGVDRFNEPIQIATYYDESRRPIAAKIRPRDKNKMFTVGDFKSVGLYGQWMWPHGGKMLVITEGELDCISVSQMQDHKWPVVSIPKGAAAALKSIQSEKVYDWVCSFEKVVIWFDNDEAGQRAAEAVAHVLPPGKPHLVVSELKDANDYLQAERGHEIISLIWRAEPYRPDGIVRMADVKKKALQPTEITFEWWLPHLTDYTYGRRLGECYAFGAGTGCGKTDFLTQQIDYDVSVLKEKVGAFFLETQPWELAKRICSKHAGKLFHLPPEIGKWEQSELEKVWDEIDETNRLFFFDHFGCADWDIIEQRIRYLAHSEKVRLFYLDHLTALAAGQGDNERVELERVMAGIGGLVKELDIIFHFVSHLSTPEGKPHEEGGRVMLRHFKGSRAIGFWSHFAFGIERDTQADDESERKRTTFRVLKDRFTGRANGKQIELTYDTERGLLKPYLEGESEF